MSVSVRYVSVELYTIEGIGTSLYKSSSCDATREATHRGEIPRLTTPASRRGPNRGSHPPESPGAVSAPIAAPEARRRRYGAGFSRCLRLGGCTGSRSTGVTHRHARFWRRDHHYALVHVMGLDRGQS